MIVSKSFAEIAVDLRIIATSDAISIEHVEMLWAKEGHPVFAHTLAELRQRAASLAAAHEIILRASTNEVAIRKLLEMEVPNAGIVGDRPRAGAVARTAGDREC